MTEVQPQELRVSDDERRAVDARLHRAVGEGRLSLLEYEERSGLVWSARTRGELDSVTRDLPGSAPAPVPLLGGTRRAVAVMGDERLQGPFAEGQRVEGWAVMGSAKLDLARPDLPRDVEVRAVAVMGDVQVVVPTGAQVHLVGGMSFMGDRTVRVTEGDGPVVRVRGWALMGSVQVRSADVPTGLAAVVQRVAEQTGHAWHPTARQAGIVAARPPRRRRRWIGAIVAGALLVTVGGGVADAVGGDGRVAIMSGAQVQVGSAQTEQDVTAVMGGAEVVVAGSGEDLQLDASTMWGGVDVVVVPDDAGQVTRRVQVDARALMGGVTVTVPTGTSVRVEGGMLMGGTSCDDCPPFDGDEADVVVDARGAMGGVSVEFEPAEEILGDLD